MALLGTLSSTWSLLPPHSSTNSCHMMVTKVQAAEHVSGQGLRDPGLEVTSPHFHHTPLVKAKEWKERLRDGRNQAGWPFSSPMQWLVQDLNAGPSLTIMASCLQLQLEPSVPSVSGAEFKPLPFPAQALKQCSEDAAPQRGSEPQLIYISSPGSPRIC